ncbi:MAG: hypothetical protein LH617_13210 [Ramlibacter sp.]|nr:hypothetical protein [Ramlibacter sp.]
MTGAACAPALSAAGHSVRVFDHSRGRGAGWPLAASNGSIDRGKPARRNSTTARLASRSARRVFNTFRPGRPRRLPASWASAVAPTASVRSVASVAAVSDDPAPRIAF